MRYPVLPNCIFRETFDSLSSVAQNGGAVTGTPTISNGYTTTLANAQKISYPKMKGVLNNATKFVIDLDFTTGSDITSYTDLISEWDASGRLQYMVQIINGFLIAYVGAASNYGSFALATNTRYRLRFSYDGSQATNALKLVCYKDGAAQALTFSGTIPTSMPFDISYTLTLNGTTASSVHVAGIVVKEVAIYKGVTSSLEEALDIYQQDTISELDASKALVYLPLKSWYYKENGTQLLTDGDMEAAGVAAWSVDHSATLTKETSSPQSGTQWLKIAYNGVANPGAYQSVVTSGKRYKLSGYIKGDGTRVPQICSGATVVWTGTSSTSWQAIGGTTGYIEFIAGGSYVEVVFLASDGYVGVDNLRVELMEARTDNIGSLGGYALLGDGSTTTTFPSQLNPHGMSFDGGDYLNIDMGIGPLLTLSMPFTFSVLMYDNKGLSDTTGYSLGGTWDTAQGKGVLFYKYPSTSYGPGVLIGSSSGNFLEARGKEAPPGIHLYTFTYDGSGTFAGIMIYIDGKLSSWINGSTGTLGSDIVSGKGVMLGARWNGAASPHQYLTSGKRILDVSIYPFVLTPVQVKMLSDNLNKTKNV